MPSIHRPLALPAALLAAALGLILPATTAAENARAAPGWTLEDTLAVRGIDGVSVSPEGDVVYAVSSAVMDEKRSAFVSQLHLAPHGGESFQLTFGEKSSSNPVFSPDGRLVAFVSSRDGAGDLYLIRPGGGEAWRLTELEVPIGDHRFAPDGRGIFFTAPEPESEDEKKKKEGGDDARVVDADLDRAHLWLVPLPNEPGRPGEPRQLTRGEIHVSPDFAGGFDVSPDGRTVAFAHAPRPIADDWTLADVSLLDVESGEIRPLAATGASESSPRYSPDGRRIAFLRGDDPPTWGFTADVWVVDAGGGEPRRLAHTPDRWVRDVLGWSADGREIYVFERYRTADRVWALPADGGAPRALDPGERPLADVAIDPSATRLAFESQSLTEPSEVYRTALASWEPQKVSATNAHLPDGPLGRTEILTWRAPDGLEIEGLLTYPVGYEEGKRVPLLLNVHGGPMGVFRQTFLGSPGYPIASFAANGYAVLRANIRGSTGYGRDFRYANYNDWGGMDYRDLMAGVDRVIEMGVADPERLGVLGWSYGGYMSSWIITQTDRFRAASIGAPPTNLMSFNGTSDVLGFIPDFLGVEFWEDLEPYRRHSPLFNVSGVTTPALIQHGENDLRVPVGQGYELYNALKRQGVEVEMVVYPRTPHGIREPRLRLDMMRRNLEWFDRFLEP